MERQVINPWTWQDEFAYVQAVEVTGASRTVYCAGQTSVDRDGTPLHADDMRAQLDRAVDNLETLLSSAGLGLSHVVRLNIYTVDVDATFAAYRVLAARLSGAGCRASGTLLGVMRLAHPALLVELEATAVA